MSTVIVAADWIKRIADDERKRDAARALEEETVLRKDELVRLNGRRLLEAVHSAVTRDAAVFTAEFAGDRAREIVVDAIDAVTGGFAVRKPGTPAVTLTAAAHLETAAIDCLYQFTSKSGLPPREERVELVFVPDAAGDLQIKIHRTGQVFTTADALSEYLMGPVFTGRPR
jgi:hypothetical protein